jgi:hypothetical protein
MASSSPSNDEVSEVLQRLIDHYSNGDGSDRDPPHLSHYRDLPSDVMTAYDLLHQGAQLVHGTATKYTLVGKISEVEQRRVLTADIQRGCEVLAAATHILLQDSSGCSRAVRRSAVRACLAVMVNVRHLVGAFQDHSALSDSVGAQKTGAVWESCDYILSRMLPQGNRNAIRRELFTWTRECQDSMEEFQEMVDLGPRQGGGSRDVEEEQDDDDDDDFFGGEDGEQQYTEEEMPMAKACLGILKNSRGNMKIAVETCEALGEKVRETSPEDAQCHLDAIAQVHGYARLVGVGVTDLGSLMYPPILPASADLEAQVRKQVDHIKCLQDYILGLEGMPSNISEFANILRNAAQTRESEFFDVAATIR